MKLIRFLLFPFAVIYDVITSLRNKLFDLGILKSTSFSVPVIVVGNLNVGGTGKTPQIEYLIRLLKKNFKIAVLSRGYKRKTKGFLLLNSTHSAEDVGDEPLQFFKKFTGINVAVDTDRTNGIQQLLKKETLPEVVLLDDAFQHRKVKAGYYVLLTKYNDLFSDDFLLPTGNLRESRRGVRRANLIIVTKCPKNLSQEKQKTIINKMNLSPEQEVFFSAIIYDEELKGTDSITINDLKEKEVLLITGIANPDPLLNHLKTKGIKYRHLKYPDHHHFSNDDLVKIKTTFNSLKSKERVLLTTEKDYVRLEKDIADLNYIEIKTSFLEGKKLFDSHIHNFISK